MSERVRALRGAITVNQDDATEVLASTTELLEDIIARNGLVPDDMVSIIFTATDDITSQFPAVAARDMGLATVPLICAREIPVEGSLPLCIRLMIHAYMPPERQVVHTYLREAVRLRDDLTDAPASSS